MPHSIKTATQAARGPFEISDFPDKLSDTTVAFAACKAVPQIVDRKFRHRRNSTHENQQGDDLDRRALFVIFPPRPRL